MWQNHAIDQSGGEGGVGGLGGVSLAPPPTPTLRTLTDQNLFRRFFLEITQNPWNGRGGGSSAGRRGVGWSVVGKGGARGGA